MLKPVGIGVIGNLPPGGAPLTNEKEAYFETDWNANFGNLRTRSVAGTGGHRFPFSVPADYNETIEAYIEFVPVGDFTDQDIDLESDYAANGENYQTHSEIDAASVYSGAANIRGKLDISSVLSSLTAGDSGGVFVDHNAIGTTVHYGRLVLRYR